MSVVTEAGPTSFFPALYHGADRTATASRRRYMRLVAVNLGLVLTVAVVAAVSMGSDDARRIQAMITAGTLGLSLTLSVAMTASKYDRIWVKSRALAESIKSSAWRFAMSAQPFDAMSTTDAQKKLLAQLHTLAGDAEGVGGPAPAENRPDITQPMVALRQALFDIRRHRYVADRIADQRDWFALKARSADRAGRVWNGVLLAAQTAALVAALAAIWSPVSRINARAVFVAVAAASLGWLRATQHRELAATYTAMAQMLERTAESARSVDTEDALTAIVLKTETALEQENGAWIHRRFVT